VFEVEELQRGPEGGRAGAKATHVRASDRGGGETPIIRKGDDGVNEPTRKRRSVREYVGRTRRPGGAGGGETAHDRGRSRGKKLLLSHGPTEISWSLRSSRRGTVPMPAAIFRALNRRTRARLAAVPGPTPWFPLGTLGDFLGPWPWERCAEYGRRYGGVALVWLFNRPAVVLDDPDLIGQVLDTRAPTST